MKKPDGRIVLLGIVLVFSWNIAAVASDLAGSEWRPVKAGDVELPDDSGIFIRFQADGQVTGHGGCNGFFASYKLGEHTMKIDHLAATRMACPQAVMDREGLFMKALEATATFVRDGTRLTLTDGTGSGSILLVQTDAD